jgi:parallel beta-helix repeat protein
MNSRFIYFIIIALTWSMNSKAQLAGGTYTIGPTGNYATFSAAVTAMASGITGPVIFNADPAGTYVEQVLIPEISGASATNSIVFNGNGATISFDGSYGNAHVVHLNGADYITLNDLTIETLNSSYGVGIWLSNNADYNTINNCVIDISSVSSSGSNSSAGIASSRVSTSFSTGTDANSNHITISNNTIMGSPNLRGMYYGIALNGTGNNAGSQSWIISNNTIQDFYYYGIKVYRSEGLHRISNNNIHRENKSEVGDFMGIELNYGGKDNIIEKNNIHDPFSGIIGFSNKKATGIYAYQCETASASEPNIYRNNTINIHRGTDNGTNYGLNFRYRNNYTYVYHNTVAISMDASGSTNNYDQIGIFIDYIFSTGYFDNSEVKNNIVHLDIKESGNKYLFYTYGQSAHNGDYDYNCLSFARGMTDHYVGYFDNTIQEKFSDWQVEFGANSINANPFFADISTNDLTPSNAALNANGFDLFSAGLVIDDINGTARNSTPDIGAIEFNPTSDDAGIQSIDNPVFAAVPGVHDIRLSLTNYGSNPLTAADVKWQVDGGVISTFSWMNAGLAPGNSDDDFLVGAYNFSPGSAEIQAWVENPNGQPGGGGVTDTVTETVYICSPLSGAYSIGGAGADYPDLSSAAFDLQYCGVSGPVVFNITAGSTYTEQVEFHQIPGSSATNTITFNGNGSTVQASPSSLEKHIINFDGADYVEMNNLTIKTTNTTYGYGVLLGNDANYITITGCTIDISAVTSSSTNSAGIVSTLGTLPEANNITISNNLIKGNPTGNGMYYGIYIYGSAQNMGSTSWNISNNVIQDFYQIGIYVRYTGGGHLISGNNIHRENKTSGTDFYGIQFEYAGIGNITEKNFIHDPFTGFTSTSASNDAFGISTERTNGTSANPNIIRNNMIILDRGVDEGANRGFYLEYSNDFNYLLNNTVAIIMHNTGSGNTSDQFGIHVDNNWISPYQSNSLFKNNILFMDVTALGRKYLIYLDRSKSYQADIDYNSFYFTSGMTNHYIGFLDNNNLTTFADWQVHFGPNSVNDNPFFVDYLNGNFTPSNAALNNNGFDFFTPGYVTEDFNGTARSNSPDLGALEFIPTPVDAGVVNLDNPIISTAPGNQSVEFTVKNFGLSTLTSADIKWEIDGSGTNTFAWVTAGLGSGNTQSNISVGNYNFVAGTSYIKAWLENPNGQPGGLGASDTLFDSVYVCDPLAGTYTIGGVGADYPDFSSAISDLTFCGVSGPVVFNVNPASVFNEQVEIPQISGASAVNTITFNGNGAELSFNPSDISNKELVYLNGADFVIFDSLMLTSSGSMAWGFRLGNKAEYNVIRKCTVDFSAMNGSSGRVTGIVSSHTDNSPTSQGVAAEANFNSIIQNHIIGSTTAYMDGILLSGENSGTISRGNIIDGNIIEDFYGYGIYLYYTGGNTILRNNDLSRPNTSVTRSQIYAIDVHYGSTGNSIESNRIHDLYANMAPTSGWCYGIYYYYMEGSVSNPSVISNNIIDLEINGEPSGYGIFIDRASHTHILHNTIAQSSSSSSAQYGIFLKSQSGTRSMEFSKVKNNIIYFDVSGTGLKYAFYLDGTYSSSDYHGDYNYNNYYIPNPAGNIYTGYYYGNSYSTLSDWQTAKGGFFDQNSKDENPSFLDRNNGDFTPESAALDGSAANELAFVPDDYFGVARSNPPDFGAIEFTSLVVNATALSIDSPSDPAIPGLNDIRISIKNLGLVDLTSVRIWWRINGGAPSSFLWGGTVLPDDTLKAQLVGSHNFAAGTSTIEAWLSDPNGFPGGSAVNDTVTKVVNICHPLAGIYTIGGVGANFPDFTSAIDQLNNCGISGPVTFNVTTATYNEKFVIQEILGASATNTITINGNGSTLTHSTSDKDRHIIFLNGADYITIDSLTIKSQDLRYCWAVRLGSGANYNTIRKCSLDLSSTTNLTYSDESCGVISTDVEDDGMAGPFADANYNLISGNVILGGAVGESMGTGIQINGIARDSGSVGNTIVGNKFLDFNFTGVFISRTGGFQTISQNEFSRPSNNDPNSFSGIYLTESSKGNTVERNLMHNPFGGLPGKNANFTGITISTCLGTAADPNIVSNNIMSVTNGTGSFTGFSITYSDYTKIYHNSTYVNITSNELIRGFYLRASTSNAMLHSELKNNLVYLDVDGTGDKYIIYLYHRDFFTLEYGDYDYNAYYFHPGMSNNHVGSYSDINFTTLAQWQTANNGAFDQNSLYTNTNLNNPINGDYSPVNTALNNSALDLFTGGQVTVDYYGVARTGTPDIGAVEFSPPSDDAGITSIDVPSSVIAPGVSNIEVTIKNFGLTTLSTATIQYEVNGGAGGSYAWSGTLALGASENNVGIGSYNFATGVNTVRAWTENPNGNVDLIKGNDTSSITFWVCNPLSGTYTVGGVGADFSDFTEVADALSNCGVSGPVVFNVNNTITYEEQFELPQIAGASAVNTITINGNGALLRFEPTVQSKHIIYLNGADYVTIDSLIIQSLSTGYGLAVRLGNGANYNTITRCTMDMSLILHIAMVQWPRYIHGVSFQLIPMMILDLGRRQMPIIT